MERMHARFDPDAPFLQHFRDAWALDAALVVQEITSSANDIECPRTAAAAFPAAVEPNFRDYDCIVRVVTALEHVPIDMLAFPGSAPRISGPIYANWQAGTGDGWYHYLPILGALEHWDDVSEAGIFLVHNDHTGVPILGKADRDGMAGAVRDGWVDRRGVTHQGWVDQTKAQSLLASLDREMSRLDEVAYRYVVHTRRQRGWLDEIRHDPRCHPYMTPEEIAGEPTARAG